MMSIGSAISFLYDGGFRAPTFSAASRTQCLKERHRIQYRAKLVSLEVPTHPELTPQICVAAKRRCANSDLTHCNNNAMLFNHLVGGREQRVRHDEAHRLRGLEVDHQFVLGRRLHR